MPITITAQDNVTRISISDRFDYSIHTEFRSAYKDTPKGTEFIIDLGKASYMDSSALGMLLLLRERIGEDGPTISIVGCTSEIRKILEISNFGTLFNIS